MEKVLVTRSSMPGIEEYFEEIKDLWDSHWLTNMGCKHEALRELLINYLDVKNIELLTNGHMALELTLQSFGFKEGAEVITTPFTFASTTHAIVRNGLVPVFCDINRNDYTIDASKIEELITDKTCAILPVHVYGNICAIEEIERIARKYNLKVIYDAAHSFGELYKGKGVGAFGDASCFSFHATKVFNTIEGGAVCFNNAELGARLYDLKNFGIHGPEEVTAVGANAKMNEFCAAMGICNLRHIDEEIEKRKQVFELYTEKLNNTKGIITNKLQADVKSNYAYYPIIVNEEDYGINRNELSDRLQYNGIVARKYFYPLTSDFACYKGLFECNNTPVAKKISERVLTLPMYADLDEATIDRICNVINAR